MRQHPLPAGGVQAAHAAAPGRPERQSGGQLAADAADVFLRDLGLHRLKDLGRPEQVFQLTADGLDDVFPALATLDNPELPNNLPGLLSAFVGRDRELAEVRELARTSRLVTLTGAGGSGKTRLALQAAAELLDGSANGVWLAELAALTDGGQVAWAVAAALGLAERTGPPSAESVAEALGGQDVRIVLDNCEHLIDAAAKFCEYVIRHCPRTRFLATSREPLGIVERFAISRARTEVMTSLRRAVEQPGSEQSTDLANPLVATVKMMQFFDRQEEGRPLAVARQFADRALAIAVTLGDKSAQACALSLLAGTSYLIGDQESAYQQAVGAVALARQTGDVHLLGDGLGILAIAAPDEDQRAIRLEALECFRRSGDELLAATELHMIYGLDLHAGQLDHAQSHLEEAVALAEPLGDEVHLYFFRSDLVMLRLIQARYAEAEPEVRRCLLVARRTGLVMGAAEVILGAACCAAWHGDHEKAARLHSAADAAIEASIGDRTMMWSDPEQRMRAREQGQLRELMGGARYDAAYRAGRLLSSADAVELALSREAPERAAAKLR